MNRKERTEQKMQELFHSPRRRKRRHRRPIHADFAGLHLRDVCYTGSLDNRMRELVTVTVLDHPQRLPQAESPCRGQPQRRVHAGGDPGGRLPVRAVYRLPQDAQCYLHNERGVHRQWHRPAPAGPNDIDRREGGRAVSERAGDARTPLRGRDRRPLHLAARRVRPGRAPVPHRAVLGDFNTREGLEGKTRELLTVVLPAALGGAEVQVKSHVEGALKAGNTKEEVVCALVHASGYMGFPGCSTP